MDKKIVDKLIQFGLITNVGVDASKYTDVDDLIAKGIVTIPGAKAKIMELIGDDHIVIEELPVEANVVDAVVDTPVETPAEEEVVVEEVVEDTTPESVVVEEVAEAEVVEEDVVVEETTTEDVTAKAEKKSGKSSKNN